MDHGRFDGITRSTTGHPTRRALVRVLAGSALGAIVPRLAEAEPALAKRKKRKKGARCMSMRQSCAGGRCCGSLGCGDNGCAGGAVCFQHEGGGCGRDCDCRGDLNCSERAGGSCQACGYPETPCTFTSDCCLQDSICGDNGCAPTPVCCQWEIGSLCYDDCDCCAELGCFGGACLPLLTVDGGERPTRQDGAAARSPEGQWPRQERHGVGE